MFWGRCCRIFSWAGGGCGKNGRIKNGLNNGIKCHFSNSVSLIKWWCHLSNWGHSEIKFGRAAKSFYVNTSSKRRDHIVWIFKSKERSSRNINLGVSSVQMVWYKVMGLDKITLRVSIEQRRKADPRPQSDPTFQGKKTKGHSPYDWETWASVVRANPREVGSLEINRIKCFQWQMMHSVLLLDQVTRRLTMDLFGKTEVRITWKWDFNRVMGWRPG